MQYLVLVLQEKSQDLINIILKNRQRDKSFNEYIESHKFCICEKDFTADQIYVYPSRKSLKEEALPNLNCPHPIANAYNNLSRSAIEKNGRIFNFTSTTTRTTAIKVL